VGATADAFLRFGVPVLGEPEHAEDVRAAPHPAVRDLRLRHGRHRPLHRRDGSQDANPRNSAGPLT
jgi:hypothetical protein